jgi:predicted component of type VI protein secretion system
MSMRGAVLKRHLTEQINEGLVVAEPHPAMMELHVCNKNGALLRAFALGDTAEVIVGRDESCDIRIMARSVSREHCLIEQQGEHLVLRDLNSTGGTYINGDRIDQVEVEDGVEVNVGPAVLKFYENPI